MATRSLGNSIAADDAIDLEAMRKEDFSWHPCHVSLSSSGVGLFVDYGSTDLEDVIIKEEEVLARLRIRSVPLHGDDCIHVQEGEHVLATPKLRPKSLFFDAAVEKVLRVRHSKKVYCRCTFTIRWLHQDLKGESLTVPSGSIMRLAPKSINVHPTICAFFSSLKSSSCSSPSPPSVVEDMDNEIDLHELLEKQIEEISNSVDITKKRIPGYTLVGIEVDNNGQVQRRVVSGSRASKSLAPVLLDQNHMKRTTRSARKLQMEIEANDPQPPTALIQGELSESRSPLNPLAARAALASLVSQMPKSLETSNYEENLDSSDDIICKQDVLQSLKGTKTCSSPTGYCLSRSSKFSLETAATTVAFDPDHNKDVKPVHPTDGSTEQPVLMDAYSGIPINGRKIKTNGTEIPDSSISCSVAKRKLSLPLKTTRLTRSQTERGAASQDDTIEQKTSLEEKPMSAASARRFTRSAIRKGGEPQPIKGVQAMEEDASGQVVGNGDSRKRPKRKCTSK